jgi:6-phosphofructokinase 1
MVALRDGVYTTVSFEAIRGGTKRVDVSELYDSEQYVPRVRQVRGKPMFLY